jgi:hypothetical protein
MAADDPKNEDYETEDTDEPLPQAARRIPATFCDTYYLSYWPDRVRIALGERLEGETYFRVSVMMPMGAVRALHRAISEILEEYEPKAEHKKNQK